MLTGMMEMIHAVFVLTLCGTKYKVWTGCGGSLCAAGVLTEPSQRQHLSGLQVTQTSAAETVQPNSTKLLHMHKISEIH